MAVYLEAASVEFKPGAPSAVYLGSTLRCHPEPTRHLQKGRGSISPTPYPAQDEVDLSFECINPDFEKEIKS